MSCADVIRKITAQGTRPAAIALLFTALLPLRSAFAEQALLPSDYFDPNEPPPVDASDIEGLAWFTLGADPAEYEFSGWLEQSLRHGLEREYSSRAEVDFTGMSLSAELQVGVLDGVIARVLVSWEELPQFTDPQIGAYGVADAVFNTELMNYPNARVVAGDIGRRETPGGIVLQDRDGDQLALLWTAEDVQLICMSREFVQRFGSPGSVLKSGETGAPGLKLEGGGAPSAAVGGGTADVTGFGDYHLGTPANEYDWRGWEKLAEGFADCPLAYVRSGELSLTGPPHQVKYVLGFQQGELAHVMVTFDQLITEFNDPDEAEAFVRELREMLLNKYAGARVVVDDFDTKSYQVALVLEDGEGDRASLGWDGFDVALLYVSADYVRRAKAAEAQRQGQDAGKL